MLWLWQGFSKTNQWMVGLICVETVLALFFCGRRIVFGWMTSMTTRSKCSFGVILKWFWIFSGWFWDAAGMILGSHEVGGLANAFLRRNTCTIRSEYINHQTDKSLGKIQTQKWPELGSKSIVSWPFWVEFVGNFRAHNPVPIRSPNSPKKHKKRPKTILPKILKSCILTIYLFKSDRMQPIRSQTFLHLFFRQSLFPFYPRNSMHCNREVCWASPCATTKLLLCTGTKRRNAMENQNQEPRFCIYVNFEICGWWPVTLVQFGFVVH